MTQDTGQARPDVRAAILASAAQNFQEHGYSGADLRTIARDAGYTKGAIYSSFGSKPELFCQVCMAHSRIELESIAQTIDQVRTSGSSDPVGDFSRRVATSLMDDVPWQLRLAEFRQIANSDPKVSLAYRDLVVQRFDAICEALATFSPSMGIDGADMQTISIAILGLANAMALEHCALPDIVTESLVADAICRTIKGILQ